jgi:hypothetical protein
MQTTPPQSIYTAQALTFVANKILLARADPGRACLVPRPHAAFISSLPSSSSSSSSSSYPASYSYFLPAGAGLGRRIRQRYLPNP